MKYITSLFLVSIIIVFSTVDAIKAKTEYPAIFPDNCVNCYDSNSYGAFACGYDNNTVYSVQIFPNYKSRSVKCGGSIKAVIQSGKYTYALICKNLADYHYVLLELNTENGNYKYYDIKNEADISTASFSVSNGYLYLIKKDSIYAYIKAVNIYDGSTDNLSFNANENVVQVFNNNEKSYALLSNGKIFRITGNDFSLCASVAPEAKISNAGAGKIYEEGSRIVALDDGQNSYLSDTKIYCASVSEKYLYYTRLDLLYLLCDNTLKSVSLTKQAKAVLSYKSSAAVIATDNSCTTFSNNDFKSNSQASSNSIKTQYKVNSSGILYAVEPLTSVSDFKKKFTSDIKIFNANGKEVTSGIVKTGYVVKSGGNSYSIAVKGDLNGSGSIKSNDTSMLMKYFTEEITLSKTCLTAADFNLDGSINNKDLVLIARQK